jgi:hypothetical protein
LHALSAADESIRANPAAARLIVGKMVKEEDAIMEKLFVPDDYAISLDQAIRLSVGLFVLAMSARERAIQSGHS